MIWLLFEAPSGFAVFYFDGAYLYVPDAMENIWANFSKDRAKRVVWLKEYRYFKDKSDAINSNTDLNSDLTAMLQKWVRPGQKLAVGKQEYKKIIEARLGICCLYDDAVMEAMLGVKNLMGSLLPEETLGKLDRPQMSRGLKMFLKCYGFEVEPETVNEHIIETSYTLYDIGICMKNHAKSLSKFRSLLEEMSCIRTQDWSLMKLAKASTIVCYPDYEITFDHPEEMFSAEELIKLLADAPNYEGKLIKISCLRVYHEVVWAHEARVAKEGLLQSLVKEAREAYEAEHETCTKQTSIYS